MFIVFVLLTLWLVTEKYCTYMDAYTRGMLKLGSSYIAERLCVCVCAGNEPAVCLGSPKLHVDSILSEIITQHTAFEV